MKYEFVNIIYTRWFFYRPLPVFSPKQLAELPVRPLSLNVFVRETLNERERNALIRLMDRICSEIKSLQRSVQVNILRGERATDFRRFMNLIHSNEMFRGVSGIFIRHKSLSEV